MKLGRFIVMATSGPQHSERTHIYMLRSNTDVLSVFKNPKG